MSLHLEPNTLCVYTFKNLANPCERSVDLSIYSAKYLSIQQPCESAAASLLLVLLLAEVVSVVGVPDRREGGGGGVAEVEEQLGGGQEEEEVEGQMGVGASPPLHIYTHTDEMQTKEAEGP